MNLIERFVGWSKNFLQPTDNPEEVDNGSSGLLPYQRRAPFNPKVDATIQDALNRYGLVYGVVINNSGDLIAEAGHPDGLRYRGMVSALFGPEGSAKNTYDWIASTELLPQLYGQGEDYAVLDVPLPGFVVVACGTSTNLPPDLDVKTDYALKSRISKHLCDRLRPLL
jgi:hypothetical protein